MADCSAAGTALDRVASAATGAAATTSSSNTSNHISNLISQVASKHHDPSMTPRPLIPAAPPTSIETSLHHAPNVIPPNVHHPVVTSGITTHGVSVEQQNSHNTMDAAWMAAQGRHHHHHPPPRYQPHTMPHHPQAVQMTQMMNMQMQMAQMMQHQQQQIQQQQIQQQQQQIQQQQIQQQQQQITSNETNATVNDVISRALDDAYEDAKHKQQTHPNNIDDDVLQYDNDTNWDDIQGNDVTIEELAEAWSNAQTNHLYPPQPTTASTTTTIPPYEFSEESLLPPPPDTSLLPTALSHYHSGRTNLAISHLERHLRHAAPHDATAWLALGKCHAENDHDRRAISCFEKAVDCDPYASEASLALGVSHVNELNYDEALRVLESWVDHHPKFAGRELRGRDDGYGGVVVGETVDEGGTTAMAAVEGLLLNALAIDPDDADVHTALGVCYNITRDYDAAVDHFRLALESHPGDYQLWNKLGATLANANRSAEALPAYHKALEMKPKYARAWLNTAISHCNLKDYDEAARCYLQTLSLNPSAGHTWNYLRIALTCAERWDLLPLVAARDVNGFKEYYDFVMD